MHVLKSPFTCSVILSSPFLHSVFILSFRTPRFSRASSSQPGGHEEQECGEFGSHSSGNETLPVPPELLRAGNHTWRLHPRCRSGPGTFLESNPLNRSPDFTSSKRFQVFIVFLVLPGSAGRGSGLPLPRMRPFCPPLQPWQLAGVDEGPPRKYHQERPVQGPIPYCGQQKKPETPVERRQTFLPVGRRELKIDQKKPINYLSVYKYGLINKKKNMCFYPLRQSAQGSVNSVTLTARALQTSWVTFLMKRPNGEWEKRTRKRTIWMTVSQESGWWPSLVFFLVLSATSLGLPQ